MNEFIKEYTFNEMPFSIHYRLDHMGQWFAELLDQKHNILASGTYPSPEVAEEALKRIAIEIAYRS